MAWQSWLVAPTRSRSATSPPTSRCRASCYWIPVLAGIIGSARRGARAWRSAGATSDERRGDRRRSASRGLLALIFARVPIARRARGERPRSATRRSTAGRKALKMFGTVPFTLASAYSLSVIPLFILMGAVASRAQHGEGAVRGGERRCSPACAARSRTRPSAPARCSARSAARRSPPRRRSRRWRSRRCAATATTPAFAAGAVAVRRHARRPDPAVGAARDLRDRRRAVAAEALRRGVHPRLRARRAVRARGVRRRRGCGRSWVPQVPAMRSRERLRAAVGMWKLGVLFFFAVVGIYLGWFSPTEAAAVAAFAAIVIALRHAARWAGAASVDGAARDRLHHRGDLLHRRRRVHLLALHRADAVAERAGRAGCRARASRRSGSCSR